MAEKKLLIILNTTQEYIKHTGDEKELYAAPISQLFESISNAYLPLVRMLEKFEKEELPVKLSLVLVPVLCTLLEDPEVQNQYIEWLDKKIEFGKSELTRLSGNEKLLQVAKECLERTENDKRDFEKYERRLIKKFSEFKKKGLLELIATCATDIYLPFYTDMYEVMSAQVEAGIFAFRSFFGDMPNGFWLPELGYYKTVENVLHDYNINYTILGTQSFLFSTIEPVQGIFYPARFDNSVIAFGRDSTSDEKIEGDEGYIHNNVYRSENCDVLFSLDAKTIEPFVKKGTPRFASGYKYWNKGKNPEVQPFNENENIYSSSDALTQVEKDAYDFVGDIVTLVNNAEDIVSDLDTEFKDVSLVVTMNITQLSEKWFESTTWLESVLRKFCNAPVVLDTPKSYVSEAYKLQKIEPYYGAISGVGYGEYLLSNKNNWMMKFVRKASERMVDLADRFPTDTGLKPRLLNLGARELFFAQSAGWVKMIEYGIFPEYARMRFIQSINDFTMVFDALGSNTVSTEWLTKLEEKHQIFPWLNFRIFSRKK